jgi:hypothetical protein
MKNVEGLIFTPAEEKMAVPYDLFARNFLEPDPPKGKGFSMIRPSLYVSRKTLKEKKADQWIKPAAELHRAKIATIKIKNDIDRIQDRISSNKGLPGDQEALQKLWNDYNEAIKKFLDMGHQFDRNVESPDARRRREESEAAQRLRDAHRNAVLDRARDLVSKTLVPNTPISSRELSPDARQVNSELQKANWVSIKSLSDGDADSDRMLVGLPNGSNLFINYWMGVKDIDFILNNFAQASPGQMDSLAKSVYSQIMNDSSMRSNYAQVIDKLPTDLKTAIEKMGIFKRGVQRAGVAVKNLPKAAVEKAKDVMDSPKVVYNYYTGRPDNR